MSQPSFKKVGGELVFGLGEESDSCFPVSFDYK